MLFCLNKVSFDSYANLCTHLNKAYTVGIFFLRYNILDKAK
jgi:hypothetical protein